MAVVGSGIAGLSAAALLANRHSVTLFESDSRLGGHSNTVIIDVAGRRVAVDTGFIVYNERTYPNLTALFRFLDVPTAESDMSFAASLAGGPEFAASSKLNGLFADRANFLRPGFLRMVRDLLRFQRDMRRRLDDGTVGAGTLGDVVADGGYGDRLRDHLLVPMAAAIWSGSRASVLDMPAETYLRFCLNHGMLTLTDRPTWRTVTGGSETYVRRLAAGLSDVRLSSPVVRVEPMPSEMTSGMTGEAPGSVDVTCAGQPAERFDHVVLATHADQALRMVAVPNADVQRLLSAIRYQPNRAYLHRDPRFMPRRRRAWSSWNYVGAPADGAAPVSVTYWMNRLQPLNAGEDIFVTLNPAAPPDRVDGAFDYAHPAFDRAAIDAQQCLHRIQGRGNIWYCGAWCGHGFHEDGLVAGMTVAQWLGAEAPWRAVSGADRVPMAAHEPEPVAAPLRTEWAA